MKIMDSIERRLILKKEKKIKTRLWLNSYEKDWKTVFFILFYILYMWSQSQIFQIIQSCIGNNNDILSLPEILIMVLNYYGKRIQSLSKIFSLNMKFWERSKILYNITVEIVRNLHYSGFYLKKILQNLKLLLFLGHHIE